MKTEYWAEKLRGHISAVNRKQRTEQKGKQKQRVGEQATNPENPLPVIISGGRA